MTNHERLKLISAIAKRATAMFKELTGRTYNHLDAFMDIDAVNAIMPLDLERFLAADDANFAHDAFGIRANLNRQTKRLENHWTPRFTKVEGV